MAKAGHRFLNGDGGIWHGTEDRYTVAHDTQKVLHEDSSYDTDDDVLSGIKKISQSLKDFANIVRLQGNDYHVALAYSLSVVVGNAYTLSFKRSQGAHITTGHRELR